MSSRKSHFPERNIRNICMFTEIPRQKTCSTAQSEKDMNGFFAFHFQEMRIYAANYF